MLRTRLCSPPRELCLSPKRSLLTPKSSLSPLASPTFFHLSPPSSGFKKNIRTPEIKDTGDDDLSCLLRRQGYNINVVTKAERSSFYVTQMMIPHLEKIEEVLAPLRNDIPVADWRSLDLLRNTFVERALEFYRKQHKGSSLPQMLTSIIEAITHGAEEARQKAKIAYPWMFDISSPKPALELSSTPSTNFPSSALPAVDNNHDDDIQMNGLSTASTQRPNSGSIEKSSTSAITSQDTNTSTPDAQVDIRTPIGSVQRPKKRFVIAGITSLRTPERLNLMRERANQSLLPAEEPEDGSEQEEVVAGTKRTRCVAANEEADEEADDHVSGVNPKIFYGTMRQKQQSKGRAPYANSHGNLMEPLNQAKRRRLSPSSKLNQTEKKWGAFSVPPCNDNNSLSAKSSDTTNGQPDWVKHFTNPHKGSVKKCSEKPIGALQLMGAKGQQKGRYQSRRATNMKAKVTREKKQRWRETMQREEDGILNLEQHPGSQVGDNPPSLRLRNATRIERVLEKRSKSDTNKFLFFTNGRKAAVNQDTGTLLSTGQNGRTLAVRDELRGAVSRKVCDEPEESIETRKQLAETLYGNALDGHQQLALSVLTEYFQLSSFNKGQWEAIHKLVFSQEDLSDVQTRQQAIPKATIVLLPTGAGKSLIYQFAAFVRATCVREITVVVSPTIGLIKDQLERLPQCLRGARIDHGITPPQRSAIFKMLQEGSLDVLITTPEQLQSTTLQRLLTTSGRRDCPEGAKSNRRPVGLVCLDEAHCLSEWGHSFRPAYLALLKTINMNLRCPRILCLTATATPSTIASMGRQLEKAFHLESQPQQDPIPANTSVDVGEASMPLCSPCKLQLNIIQPYREAVHSSGGRLSYSFSAILSNFMQGVIEDFKASSSSDCAPRRLSTELLQEPSIEYMPVAVACSDSSAFAGVRSQLKHKEWRKMNSTLVYVWKQRTAENLSTELKRHTSRTVVCYHSNMSQGERDRIQDGFMSGTARFVVATMALGMGIDKRDLNGVIHANMPASLEQYVQETGRVNRDGKSTGLCHLTLRDADYRERYQQIVGSTVDGPALRFFTHLAFSVMAAPPKANPAKSKTGKIAPSRVQLKTCPTHFCGVCASQRRWLASQNEHGTEEETRGIPGASQCRIRVSYLCLRRQDVGALTGCRQVDDQDVLTTVLGLECEKRFGYVSVEVAKLQTIDYSMENTGACPILDECLPRHCEGDKGQASTETSSPDQPDQRPVADSANPSAIEGEERSLESICPTKDDRSQISREPATSQGKGKQEDGDDSSVLVPARERQSQEEGQTKKQVKTVSKGKKDAGKKLEIESLFGSRSLELVPRVQIRSLPSRYLQLRCFGDTFKNITERHLLLNALLPFIKSRDGSGVHNIDMVEVYTHFALDIDPETLEEALQDICIRERMTCCLGDRDSATVLIRLTSCECSSEKTPHHDGVHTEEAVDDVVVAVRELLCRHTRIQLNRLNAALLSLLHGVIHGANEFVSRCNNYFSWDPEKEVQHSEEIWRPAECRVLRDVWPRSIEDLSDLEREKLDSHIESTINALEKEVAGSWPNLADVMEGGCGETETILWQTFRRGFHSGGRIVTPMMVARVLCGLNSHLVNWKNSSHFSAWQAYSQYRMEEMVKAVETVTLHRSFTSIHMEKAKRAILEEFH